MHVTHIKVDLEPPYPDFYLIPPAATLDLTIRGSVEEITELLELLHAHVPGIDKLRIPE